MYPATPGIIVSNLSVAVRPNEKGSRDLKLQIHQYSYCHIQNECLDLISEREEGKRQTERARERERLDTDTRILRHMYTRAPFLTPSPLAVASVYGPALMQRERAQGCA